MRCTDWTAFDLLYAKSSSRVDLLGNSTEVFEGQFIPWSELQI